MAQLSVLSYPPQYVEQLPSIENFLTHLEGKGRLPNTITAYEKNLQLLAQTTNLKNPVEVELAIARYKLFDSKTKKRTNRPASTSYKAKLCDCYAMYRKYYKIEWEKPIYTPEPAAIQPPTREKAAMLVSAARGELSIKIDIIRQTGYRPIEIQGEKGLRAKDFHPDQNTLTNRNTKKCNARARAQNWTTFGGNGIRNENENCVSSLWKGVCHAQKNVADGWKTRQDRKAYRTRNRAF
jgi:Holliday junction resolvase RusA-like endonuclease